MLNKFVLGSVTVMCLLLASLPLTAQTDKPQVQPDNVPALLVRANEAFVVKDYLTFRKALEGLKEMRPYNSEYMYQLVIAHALLDEKSEAYEVMLGMQQQGLAYDFSIADSTMSIRNTEVFDYINDLMKMAAEPMGESEPVFTLPDSVVMPETMAWDESRQKFLIGTVAEGSILAVGKDGQVTELLKADQENRMWAVFDILVDQARKRLWVSSASVPAFLRFDPVDNGRSALFEFDLESLELIHRYPVPVDGLPHSLGNMVLSPKGDIFIADRALPIIYSKAVGEQKLKAVLASRSLVSMRGIAMQADGRIMYVADREMGIMVIDIESGRSGMLAVPETLNLGGIDGLYMWNNRLIVIQNGIKPQRVMRLQLDSSGTKVTAVRPLAVAQPDFVYPSFGTLLGEDLYYFANNQWPGSAGQRKAVTVLRTPLDSNEDLVQPDMRHFLKQQGKSVDKTVEDTQKN
jgi:sugar lactone lactonase YvrE